NAPWGSFPQGPAYGVPRPRLCPNCVGGVRIAPGVGRLGESCGDCQISDGERCLPCPQDADPTSFPECAGCGAGGSRATPWYNSPIGSAVIIGVLGAVGTALTLAFLKKETKIPVG